MPTYTAYARRMHNYIPRCAILNFPPHDGSIAQAKRTSKLSVQESITISFGNNNNATTYHGSALNVATGGYYDEGTPYKFNVSDGKGNNAVVTITNVGNGVRNMVFERVKR